MSNVHIEYIALDKLSRWPKNPKEHDIETIKNSIDRFGFVAPLIIDERSQHLVVGHGRLDSLIEKKKEGEPVPEHIKVEGGQWLVPVIRGIKFEDDSEAEAYLLADNRLGELGGWDDSKLMAVLQELSEEGEEALYATGFSDEDFTKLVKRSEKAKNNSEGGEDEIEEMFGIFIECQTEEQQKELLERFAEEGIKCRALIS